MCINRIVCGFVLLMALSGCAVFREIVPQPVVAVSANEFADHTCGVVARQRGEDAAVNGYADLQVQIARDSYAVCMAYRRSGLSLLASAAP